MESAMKRNTIKIRFTTSRPQSGTHKRPNTMVAIALASLSLMGANCAWADIAPISKCPNTAYVTNSYADTVSVISTTTNKVIATIPVGDAPVNPTFTPDGKQVYV